MHTFQSYIYIDFLAATPIDLSVHSARQPWTQGPCFCPMIQSRIRRILCFIQVLTCTAKTCRWSSTLSWLTPTCMANQAASWSQSHSHTTLDFQSAMICQSLESLHHQPLGLPKTSNWYHLLDVNSSQTMSSSTSFTLWHMTRPSWMLQTSWRIVNGFTAAKQCVG